MMNPRGHYGSARVGQTTIPVYIERMPVAPARDARSVLSWILGGLVIGGAFLWTRHQSKQIEQLNKKVGLPHNSFLSSLRHGTAASLRLLAERTQPRRKDEGK
jgi:hypothetical protein